MEDFGFWSAKVLWGIFAPSHLAVILLLAAIILPMGLWLKVALRAFGLVILGAALILPVGDWALLPLERCMADQGMPMQVDGVIVLGGTMAPNVTEGRKVASFNAAADRLLVMLPLMKLYPAVPFVYSGGGGSLLMPTFNEADYVKRYFMDAGLNTSQMTFENASRNTLENALNTREIYGKIPGQSWLVVTSAYHMPRAMALFLKAGEGTHTRFYAHPTDYQTKGLFVLEPMPDLTGNLWKLDTAVKEYVGLFFNNLTGKSVAMWPCMPPPMPKVEL
jgi:uncharacterized SAM-binding protein YcdF (DUF218 family)